MQLVCDAIGCSLEGATIPSQRLYAQYFGRMMDDVKPSSRPLILKRVIVNTIPMMEDGLDGCRPHVQVFKDGKLLFDSLWESGASVPPTVSVKEGSILFSADTVVRGDVLLRCRHLTADGKTAVSMFRTSFHTVRLNLIERYPIA